MSDPCCSRLACLACIVVFSALLLPRDVDAQSNCTNPYLGENGEEVCVTITPSPGGTPVTIRGLGGVGTSGFPIVGTYGEYDLDLNVIIASSGQGLGLTTTGTVTRSSAGTESITIQIEAGWSQPLPDGAGSIDIVGVASGTSRIVTGSAAGYPVGAIPAQDVQYNGFPPVCDEVVYGPRPPGNLGPFECHINGLPMEAGAVAVQTTTNVHINDVGEMVEFGKGFWGVALVHPPLIPTADTGNMYTGARAQLICGVSTCSVFAFALARLALTCMDIGLSAAFIPESTTGVGPDGTSNSAMQFGTPGSTTHGLYACDINPGDQLLTDFNDFPCSTGQQGQVIFNTNPYGVSGVVDFTCIMEGAPGMITGAKYEDLNGNGKRDVIGIDLDGNDIHEPGVAGWEIYLDGNTSSPAITDSDGNFVFENVSPGQHTVSEQDQSPDWKNSTPADMMIVVDDGMETGDVNFGNYRPGKIHGIKFNAMNEMPVPGWTMFCYRNDEPCDPASTTTDDNGEYWFMNLRPGDYRIEEGSMTGWTPATPPSGVYTFSLASGQEEQRNFFNTPPDIPPPTEDVHLWKFWDIDEDGVADEGEPGLNGRTFELLLNGSVVDTQVTHAHDVNEDQQIDPVSEHGWIWFTGLQDGNYVIREVAADGYTSTAPWGTEFSFSVPLPPFFATINWGNIAPLDYGDLPDPRDDATSSDCEQNGGSEECYPTLRDSDGARHLIVDQPYVLGYAIDGESDGQPSADALEDDENDGIPFIDYMSPGDSDFDEDGLEDVRVDASGVITFDIRVSGPGNTEQFLDAWIDLNDDGYLDPAAEMVLAAEPVTPNQLNTVSTDPLSYVPGNPIGYVRFRLSSVGDLDPYGHWRDGEVEDWDLFDIDWPPPEEDPDMGDAPEEVDPDHPDIFPVGYPTTLANDGASHAVDSGFHLGDRIDAEPDGQPTIPADGDDDSPTPESDDEDGVRFASDFITLQLQLDPDSDEESYVPGIIRGTDAMIEVSASAAGYLNAWADWNRDGDWADDGEQLYDDEPLTTGDNELVFSAPSGASVGFTYLRFRFTPQADDVGFAGPGGTGEVEDYLVAMIGKRELDSTDDTPDADPGDGICADAGGMCTFRASIMEANAGDIPWVVSSESLGKSGLATLMPQTPYPPVTGTLILDGNASLEIDGSQAGAGAHGLVFESSGNLITSTYLHSFDGDGVRIQSNDNNVFDIRSWNNGGAGVNVVSGTRNYIRTNSIEGNTGLGIDLGGDGVTDNDAGDADTGANGLQNYPVLTAASAEGVVNGDLHSTPNSEFVVDFFASSMCHDSGYGEGSRFIGSIGVSTDGAGNGSFTADLPEAGLTVNETVTATATGETSGTSEFSACFSVMDVAIERREDAELPNGYALKQNYPNPFNPVTTFTFAVPESEHVTVDVFDLLGKHVANVVDRQVSAGEYSVQFDASALPSGTYVYRMTAGEYSMSRQFTLLK